ncbi:SF1B family DNA helicase RecD2 [Merismopedia glauca]|uniref:ATP-dependent RecD2 DNA helicase n=1 Tax=Merismopedia glauca CCAP 1448/3 TaxID=1296344 RepID=A0A2T1BX05_9CYAN|nr:ATP-dependent RecD-like DNA helicase [Merismopedia glauca]PSB00488.1 ATP-dependent RecD-like DNA helicase [Merismopedia glauca CCAP 1448/3]
MSSPPSALVSNSRSPTESITGVVERITYYSEESGYTVARLQVPRFHDLVTIVGSFPTIQPGQTLKLQGNWKEHPQYGQQFQVVHYSETKPATLTGMEKYLGSGLVKGVGPVTAKRIVAHFGLDTLDIIKNQIERLIEVPGIGKKRVAQIAKTWADQKVIKDVMVFLQGHGVSTTYAVKIFKQYGANAISIVNENPYQLAIDVYGIGFLTADKIAQNIGISPWSKYRYRSGILHVLSEAAEDGHCYLPQPELIEIAVKLLTISEHKTESESVALVIQEMRQETQLIVETDGEVPACYQPSFFYAEQHLGKLLSERLYRQSELDLNRVREWLSKFTSLHQIQLSAQQQQAVEIAASSGVMILTGGPGSGKTFTTRTIVALWKAMGKKIALAAPTGRAAQRMSEVTGIEAKTIHRLLEFDPSNRGFKRGVDNPLPYDAIAIDEASMLDLFIAHSLLKAIAPNTQLLIIGDSDQLPSVGPGNVLKDLIDSNCIPVIRLTEVFRQAASSAIIRAAYQINQGYYPKVEPISDNPASDCLWHGGGTEPEHGVQAICDIIQHLVPQLGFNPATDVQVLCPMTRGVVGTRNLNSVLQKLINSPHCDKAEIERGGQIFRVGDRIIQLKNDYDKEIFNGDLGIVTEIDRTEQEMMIQFDQRYVKYDFADLNEISLAWSVSIHKSQGSEYPVVIIPLYMQHYIMLNRNLFYTAITRARKLAVVVGSSKAIGLAVSQQRAQHRYTRLQKRLLSAQSGK